MINQILCILLCFFCFQVLNAQTLSRHENMTGTFTDGELIGDLHKFAHVFEHEPHQLHLFNKFNKTRKAQRIYNYSCLGLVGGSILGGYYAAQLPNDSSVPVGGIVAALGLTSAAAMAFLGNVVISPIKQVRKKKLLKEIGLAETFQGPSNEIHFNLALAQNGLGLHVTF